MIIGGSLFFKQDWFDKGIMYLHDFFENGSFMTINQFQTKYDLNNVDPIMYNALRILIRKLKNNPENRNLFCANYVVDINSNLSKIGLPDSYLNIKFAKCKDYYNVLIQRKKEVSAGFSYWQQRYPQQLDLLTDSFIHAKQTVHETSVLAMHYKMLHNILPVKTNLLKWKILDTNKCSFCERARRYTTCIVELQVYSVYITKPERVD